MRELAYIHGIDESEVVQRGSEVKPASFIPYTALTQGEFTLALLAEKSRILADYYQSPTYKEEAQMFENALYRGIHGSSPYVGAIPDTLINAARAINYASRLTKPATTFGINGRPKGIGKGIQIGADDQIIPYTTEPGKCKEWVADYMNKNFSKLTEGTPRDYQWWADITSGTKPPAGIPTAASLFAKCIKQHEIEKILNTGVEKCGHHTLYGYLPNGNGLPGTITAKSINQRIGQEALANVGEFDPGLMRNWLNVGVMRYNVKGANIQPYNQLETNAILTTLPPPGQKEWIAIISKYQKMRGTVNQAQVVNELMAVLRKYNQPSVGIAPAVVIAIIGAIVTLLGAVTALVDSLKQEKAEAFATVAGIGTQAFGPEENDWNLPAGSQSGGSGNNNLLLIGGGILLASLALKK